LSNRGSNAVNIELIEVFLPGTQFVDNNFDRIVTGFICAVLAVRVQMTTLVLSGSPLATPCKNAVLAAAAGASPSWLQATGNSIVDEAPISTSLRV
jgi:hypothetical protein